MRKPLPDAMRRNFLLLAVAVFCLNAGFGIYFATFNNFIVERIGIRPEELGFMEAVREVPGLLNAGFNALVAFAPAPLIGGLSLMLMGLGMGFYSRVKTLPWLVASSVTWSVGFHGWLPLEGTMALRFSEEGRKGGRIGQLRSVGGLANLTGLTLAALVALIDYAGVYLLAGLIISLGGAAILFASWEGKGEGVRLLLRRRYALYYLLNLLQGCRKQIFVVFAAFVLVKVYAASVGAIIALRIINQLLTILLSPVLGRMVDRYGERRMLSLSYGCLVLVFLGYALIHNPLALFVLYTLDNLLFFGSIALTTYVNRIAPPDEIRPTLSMGVTMNHVAAVLTPLFGGLIWKATSYEPIFLAGAAISLASLIASQLIPERRLDLDCSSKPC